MGHGSAVDTAVVSQLEGLEECGLRNNQKEHSFTPSPTSQELCSQGICSWRHTITLLI